MEFAKSNGSFCNFYPNLLKTFIILKMTNGKAHMWNEHSKYQKRRFSGQMDHSVIFFQIGPKVSLYSKTELLN